MPYVTSPGLWRLYQANVTRLDELARTGDLDSARKLVQRFQLLETEMRGVQVRKLGSALGTLAMPILTGEEDPLLTVDPAILKRFDKLWRLSEADQPREWMRLEIRGIGQSNDCWKRCRQLEGPARGSQTCIRHIPSAVAHGPGGRTAPGSRHGGPRSKPVPGRPAGGASSTIRWRFGPRNCTIS